MDSAKIKDVQEWLVPKTVKDIQSFLGLANYNRKFIKDYSKKTLSLTELTKKDIKFRQEKQQQTAFENVKKVYSEELTLKMFNSKRLIQIETDASDRALGVCITQEQDGKRHLVAYYSRKLILAEQNYNIYDKELLAIVASLQHQRVYAEGVLGLIILTDYKNLLYFTTTKVLNRK